MNVIDNFILEVHEVINVGKVVDGCEFDYVVVDMTVDGYGNISRIKHAWRIDHWEKAQQDMKYLA